MSELIDRQAAIDALKQQAETMSEWSNCYAEQRKGILTAVNIVEDLPPAQLGTNLAEVGTDTISRQAAIDAVTNELDMIDHVPQWVFDRLEGRLRQLPPAELSTNLAEVSTEERTEEHTETHACDCISRQAAIEAMREVLKPMLITTTRAQIALEKLPPAQPQRTGKWILDRSGAYCCSECLEPCAGYVMMKPRDKFCKMCGAKMTEGGAE